MNFSMWFLVTIWMTPDLYVETNIVDYFETEDDCWMAVEQIAPQIEETSESYNWDMTCLERPVVRVNHE